MAAQYKKLFLNEQRSDIRILVPNSDDRPAWRFPAHSLILCSSSEVLSTVIEALPADENGVKSITIKDISADAIVNLLEYLYTKQLQIHKWEDAIYLQHAACKYQIQELTVKCEDVIFNQISVNNLCEIVESARRLGLHSVQSRCLQLMKLHASVILNSTSFLNLSRDNMTALLSSEDLNVADEQEVVTALLKWGKKECCRLGKELHDEEIEEVLAELLDHIRVQRIEYEAGLPMGLRVRKNRCKSILGLKKKTKYQQPEICKKVRLYRPAETTKYSNTLCLAGSHCWEGIHVTKEDSVLCAILSTDHPIYLTGFMFDVVENNASGNILYISITEEASGSEVAHQECCWIDSYERKTKSSVELWHLSNTYLDMPVRIEAFCMYSIRLHTIGVTGDAFPYQSIRQRTLLADECVRFTFHGVQLTGLRKIHFMLIDANNAWHS